MRLARAVFALGIVQLASACGGGDATGPVKAGPPSSLTVTGSGQTGGAGAALAAPLVVTVTDAQGRPVPGASVAWSTSDGAVSSASGSTNSAGQAQATWTLAPRLGQQTATVTVAGTLTQSFTAQATMPTSTSLLQVAGNAQSDSVAAVLRDTLVVQVRLPSGEPLPGVAVSWSVAAGGGSVAGVAPTTDAQGRARAVWTLGTTAGEQRVTASAESLQPVNFTASALAGAPHQIMITPDSLVLDAWGDTARFSATGRDRHGNAVAGTITWASADTMVTRIAASGLVTSHRPGRVAVTATLAGASATRTVSVPLQRNAACRVPTKPQRGVVAGVPPFGTDAVILTHLPPPSWAGSRSLALDYDGDGDQDIIRMEYSFPGANPYSGQTRILRNDGGALVDATAQVLAAPVVPDHPRDFEIRDFTGDGVADAYVAQHGYDAEPFPGAPNLFFTRQAGRVAEIARTAFTPHHPTSFTHGSASGDVDCDGDFDIVEINVSNAAPNTLFLNDGSGRFTAAPASAFPVFNYPGGQPWQEAAAIDFDADGDPDLYLGARSGLDGNQDAFMVNNGRGVFRPTSAVRLPAGRYSPERGINAAKAADFDGDGLEDLFVFEIPKAFSTRSALRLWLNRGDGSFADASIAWGLPAECSAEVIEPLYVTDFNRDGWPDVALPDGCPELGGAGLLINRGGRFEFLAFGSIQPYLRQDAVTPLDIDGDGDPDLFFGERGGNPVLVRNPG